MANCVAALLLWPYLAGVMGMDGPRAITFAGRFMSTPFGIELLKATGGDESLVVVLICVTGILVSHQSSLYLNATVPVFFLF